MPFEPDHKAVKATLPLRTPQRVLVTGASGFLGSEIVRQLDEANVAVTALARQWPANSATSDHVIRCVGDITDPSTLPSAMSGVRTVIHSAGLAHQFGQNSANAQAFHQVNVQGTENVMRAAVVAGVDHVVLVSSVSVYGGGTQATDELCSCQPAEPYGVSKWQAEQVAREIAAQAGIRLVILRMATIIGEGDPGNIGRLMQAIDRGRFFWIGKGTNSKSLIYRGDAARACVTAACSRTGGSEKREQIYNITLPAAPVARIVSGLATGLGRPTPRWYIPARFVCTLGGGVAICMGRRGPIARIYRTISKWLSDDIYIGERFEQDYQFQPQVSLEEGLGREAAWYRHTKAA